MLVCELLLNRSLIKAGEMHREEYQLRDVLAKSGVCQTVYILPSKGSVLLQKDRIK